MLEDNKFEELVLYNEIDCRLLEKIINYLRNNHLEEPSSIHKPKSAKNITENETFNSDEIDEDIDEEFEYEDD